MDVKPAPLSDEKTIEAQTIGECWLECIRTVLARGTIHHDEDVRIYEVLGLSVVIRQPRPLDPFIDKVADKEVVARTLAKFAKGIVMPDRPFTYGARIYDICGTDQFEWLVERLNSKPETKSATIGLLIPGERSLQPCLTTIDAKIRNEALELQFFYRSQNIFGRQYANFMALAQLQHDLAARCSILPGRVRGYIASAHIYEFDVPAAKRLVTGESEAISDKYYLEGPRSIRQGKGSLE